jgi:hypothetical protein
MDYKVPKYRHALYQTPATASIVHVWINVTYSSISLPGHTLNSALQVRKRGVTSKYFTDDTTSEHLSNYLYRLFSGLSSLRSVELATVGDLSMSLKFTDRTIYCKEYHCTYEVERCFRCHVSSHWSTLPAMEQHIPFFHYEHSEIIQTSHKSITTENTA